MADEADLANDTIEASTARSIAEIRARGRDMEPTGECRYCGELFSQGDLRLFCDRTCADDHQRFGGAR